MRFALAGNPNCGKTTLFNSLTGSTAHVGNWPGVTVDRKEGIYKKLSEPINIIDLPGIYSMSPYTPEEIVARNYIIDEKPDLVINIVDSTNLERNLYLTTQILETDCPVIVALNMSDLLKQSGVTIDADALSKALGVPVIPISALREDGIKALMEKALQAAKAGRKAKSVLSGSYLDSAVETVRAMVSQQSQSNTLFHAVKLIEGDKLEKERFQKFSSEVETARKAAKLPDYLDNDFEAAVASVRYTYITDHYTKAIKHTGKSQLLSKSDKIDSILTHKLLGIPIFLVLMLLVFNTVFGENWLYFTGLESPGVILFNLTDTAVAFFCNAVAGGLEALGASEIISGLINDGLLAGLAAVISFLPQILFLFLFLSLMEDTGYMARVAFIMDRLLRKFGLSGKAFMPLLMGFGCSVPAMMATRTLNDEKERRLTIMLMPFFSCGAKFPIWATFGAAIFGTYADIVVFGIYLAGIVVAIIAAIILNTFVIKGEPSPFIMELPNYHLPRIKNLVLHLWEKLKGFVIRATTIIAGSTIIIWFLANFSFTLQMVDANSADSIIGMIGNFVRPIFIPLGFAGGNDGWKAVVAILTGLIAKEMVISTLGVLYTDVGGDALEDENALTALQASLSSTFSPLAAISFMIFNLLSVPCMAAVAAAHGEMRKGKYTWIAIAFWCLTAWIVSFLVFNIGSLLGLGI